MNNLTTEQKGDRVVDFYVLVCPLTWDVRYVGKTVQGIKKRMSVHFGSDRKTHCGRWIKALSLKGVRPKCIKIGECSERSDWASIEIELIEFFSRFYRLTNMTKGGEGMHGFVQSESSKDKIRQKLLGKCYISKEGIARIGAASRLKKGISTIPSNRKVVYVKSLSDDTITEYESGAAAAAALGMAKCGVSLAISTNGARKGFVFSYSGDFVQSDVSKNYRKGVIATHLSTGESQTFPSANAAAKSLELKDPGFIRKVCAGTFAKYHNYTFKYLHNA